jgi:hypothetical protein
MKVAISSSEKASSRRGVLLDKVGACASALCAVHCLLTGVGMSLLAIMGLGFLGNPWVEFSFLGVALVVGTWALIHGIKRHHSYIPASAFVLGICSILLSHFAGHSHGPGHSESMTPLGTGLAVVGGLGIVAFHWLNFRFQHRGCGCSLDH